MSAQDALDLLTAAYQYEVARRKKIFLLDDNTTSSLTKLAEHITLPSPKFGIMCCGTCGNGKTTLLYAFQRAVNFLEQKRHFSFLNNDCVRFRANMPIFDAKEIAQISKDYKEFKTIKNLPMLAIDDMGKEATETTHYGEVITPVVDLIDYRYNRQLFTFITTNLTGADIRAKYKDRIADRLNEMLCVIVFKDISYRLSNDK